MTNRMGNTQATRKRRFGSSRTWITGGVALGVVATTGAVASASMHHESRTAKYGSQDCVRLDQKTMMAIFEAWMQQGGGFQQGAMRDVGDQSAPLGGEAGKSSGGESEKFSAVKKNGEKSDEKSKKSATPSSAYGSLQQPRNFRVGWQPATVPISKLSLTACSGSGGGAVPVAPPTDIPLPTPTVTQPAPPPGPTDVPILTPTLTPPTNLPPLPTSTVTPPPPPTSTTPPPPPTTTTTPPPPPPPPTTTTPPPPPPAPKPSPTKATPVPTVTSTAS
ncbi:MAG TPA: hypothetical protein VFP72_17160 [Kineosporiaceae bacterium]|nr:hypothetical protein [Kineosporiaceae bacterium]